MDSQRNFLIITLLCVSFVIWQVWEQDKDSILYQYTQKADTIVNHISNRDDVNSNHGRKITIRTDVLELTINTCGGNIERALLLTYHKTPKSKEPLRLLDTTPEFIYQAQSGLVGRHGPDSLTNSNGTYPIYRVEKDVFLLAKGQSELVVPMVWTDVAGNIFTKTFIFKRSKYVINLNYSIQNVGSQPLEISSFGQLKQSINVPSFNNNNGFMLHAFRGAAYSTQDKKYEKYKFDTIFSNKHLNLSTKGGWIAMLQQYFVTAWIPNKHITNYFYTANLGNGIVTIGYKSYPILIQSGQLCHIQSALWIGPAIQDQMAKIAPYLDLTVDYGWLWFISQPLFKLLKYIHSFLGNWGLSIIIITLIVRGIMYPLTKAQYISMAKMRILHPKIQVLRERFHNDKQRQSQELMELYKSEKVNPFGGCFPLLIQMPIFLALYYMLESSIELRHAPFVLWICDLSAQDQYYILPILMGITMFFIQRMSPTTVIDKRQKKIMTFMPIIFVIFFLWFPSGLVLYYIVSNIVTIIQQRLIFSYLEKRGLHKKIKR